MTKKSIFIFWGHDFFDSSEDKNKYRKCVVNVLKKYNKKNKTKYILIFGDFPDYLDQLSEKKLKMHPMIKKLKPKRGDIKPEYFFPKIFQLIEKSDVAIFDLNFRNKRSIPLKLKINYNVLFELGIASGLKRDCYILCTKYYNVDKYVSDSQGIRKYEYLDYRKKDFYSAVESLLKAYSLTKRH